MSIKVVTALLMLACFAAPAAAAPITITYTDPVTGWDWGEVAETTGFSWNDVATICPQDGITPCSGSLGGLDFTGWIWATRDQVRDLFVNATDLTAAQMADGSESESNSSWAPQLVSLFEPSAAFSSIQWVDGWSATQHSSTYAFRPDVIDQSPTSSLDFVAPNRIEGKTFGVGTRGVWLHQPAAVTAPEPASLLLLGTALSGLYFHRRRSRLH